jgi:curli biogenesis system outer membrane secretion channel CsgG
MSKPLCRALLFTALLAFAFVPTGARAGDSDNQQQNLERAGARYQGPAYSIAIIKFENKTPAKVLGIGEAATDILRTQLKAAGLEPVDLTEEALRQQDELIRLQQSGQVKTGKKDASQGFDAVDFRIQGAITAYAELEEGSDMLFYQKKTQIARVSVDYALIDPATGKSLISASGSGEWRKETGGVMGFGSKSTADVGLREGALRDALAKALLKMLAKLNDVPYQCHVLMVDNQTVVIKAGERSKLAIGTRAGVFRSGPELIDPETGKSLGRREKKIGEVVVTSHVNDRLTETTITAGNGFQPGDLVRVLK